MPSYPDSMIRRVRAWLGLVLLSGVALGSSAVLAAPVKVVTSFSILGDIAQQVGGGDVTVDTLVGPNGDAHGYEPTPSDARKLGDAQVLIINGLDFETWLPRLQQAANFKGRLVQASAGVTPRAFDGSDLSHEASGHDHDHDHDHGHDHDDDHAHGDKNDHDHKHDHKDDHGHDHTADSHAGHNHGPIDPHAWQSLANAEVYAQNIGRVLAEVDPAHAEGYRQRAQAYADQVMALDATLKARFSALPAERRKVVTSHDAFGYFGDAYGVTFIPVAGLSTSAEPSAGDLVRIIEQVRREKVSAVFIENISSPRLAEQIVRETGAKIGGTLYSDALSRPGEPAATYLEMFEWNARQLLDAMQ